MSTYGKSPDSTVWTIWNLEIKMVHGCDVSRSFRKLVMTLGLAVIITSMSVALVAWQAQTALTLALSAEDPMISFSALTGTIPVSEVVQSGNRLVYFNNQSAGVLSVTFGISGTPALSLTTDAAFGTPEQVFNSISSIWTPMLTYSVAPGDGDYSDIAYTATNTHGVSSTLMITYQRDVTAPQVGFASLTAGAVLTTAHLPGYPITGTTSDGGAGIQSQSLSIGDAHIPLGNASPWEYSWTLPVADGEVYTMAVTATDWVSNAQAASITVTIDTAAPVVSAPVPDRAPWITSTVRYTWTASADSVTYQVNITNTQGLTTFLTTTQPQQFYTQALSESAGYYAQVRARDQHYNWSNWSGPGQVVTPDLTAPAITAPALDDRNKPYFHADGLHFYYTNTLPQVDYFSLSGAASDQLSDLERVEFSSAFAMTPTSSSPAFFTANYNIAPHASENGIISATVYDRAGNTRVQTYTYQLDADRPTSDVTTTRSIVPLHTPINLDWSAGDESSGVYSVTLFYRREAGSWLPYADQIVSAPTINGTFVFTPSDAVVTSTVLYEFATVAQDQIGNREVGPTAPDVSVIVIAHKLYLPVVLKNYPPAPTAQLSINQDAVSTYRLGVTLYLTDTTEGDVITRTRWKNEGDDWGAWQDFAAELPVDLSNGNGLKTVVVELAGEKGGVAEVKVSIRLFENGDFSQGLTAWQVDNSGLPAPSTVDSTTDGTAVDGLAALLGTASTSYGCSNVPLGRSGVSQVLQVPPTGGQLKFRYFMITWDGASSGSHAYDAFEVYIDAVREYDDANRHPTLTNCNTRWRVPGPQNPRPETTGWHEATLDLSAYSGQSITVAFRNYSRFDHYYNTYTYLDNVRLEP